MSPSTIHSMKPLHRIASIPGDGIGTEVVSAGLKVLQSLADATDSFVIETTHFEWSSKSYKQKGHYIPTGGLEELKKHDAILFGAVGAPDVPVGAILILPLFAYFKCRLQPISKWTSED